MKEVAGDLIKLDKNGKFDVIVHGCNCQCIMGGGIAKQIRQAFPKAYDADCRTTACDSRKIGSFSFAKVKVNNGNHLVIVNGYTQLLAGGQVKYDAVREVIKKVKQNFYGQRIGYPMIGSGLAGGDWDRIKDIIAELSCTRPRNVFRFFLDANDMPRHYARHVATYPRHSR